MPKLTIEPERHIGINPKSELNGVQPSSPARVIHQTPPGERGVSVQPQSSITQRLLDMSIETSRKTIDENIALKAEIEQLKSRLRITQLALEQQNAHVAELTAESKGNRGGDVAAGLFKLEGSSYVQMPKQWAGTEGIVTLYHAAGWQYKR
jgi:hypothetical protein